MTDEPIGLRVIGSVGVGGRREEGSQTVGHGSRSAPMSYKMFQKHRPALLRTFAPTAHSFVIRRKPNNQFDEHPQGDVR